MRTLLLVVVVLALSPSARGDSMVKLASRGSSAELPRLAIGINGPHSWVGGAFGASVYARISEHVALRGNLASYPKRLAARELLALYGGAAAVYDGRVFDLGVSAVWFPRRAWLGPLVEAGVMRRSRDIVTEEDTDFETQTRSKEYAGRVMVGWSWDRLFITLAAGLSVGRESGHDTIVPDDEGPRMTTPVRRGRVEGESYLRFGFAFGG